MEPVEALTLGDRASVRPSADAASAASWLHNPTASEARITQAQLWGDESEWTGEPLPDMDTAPPEEA